MRCNRVMVASSPSGRWRNGFLWQRQCQGWLQIRQWRQHRDIGHVLNANPALIDTSAAHGTTGDWLLDPFDLRIQGTFVTAISNALVTSNVTVQTTAATSGTSTTSAYGAVVTGVGGNITVQSALFYNSSNTLTLSAYNSIVINSGLDNFGTGKHHPARRQYWHRCRSVTNSATISTGGAVSIYYNPSGGYASPSTFGNITANRRRDRIHAGQ